MFKRVLVANRGEIALRVVRALKELGIEAVVAHSEADRDTMAVREADRTVCIGPAPSAQSYLDIPRIIGAATSTGCEAVHPGYGFLSESAEFARACQDNDLVFVGPSPEVIERTGEKSNAKQTMVAAGVPCVPGSDGEVETVEEAARFASEVGYPILIKASAGGGGKGMREVHAASDLKAQYDNARAEARVAFGNDAVYLEKLIARPRHVEVQVLADAADGTFGANTQEAVTRFQAVNGLSADGLAGAKTQELLYSGNALSADQAPKPDFLILVNRQHKLGKNDAPTDLVTIENVLSADIVKVKYSGTKADRTATEALGQMLSAAIADGVSNFQISSAYRTYSEQQKLVDNSVAKYRKNNPDWSRDRCLSATYNTVAPAGTSEHQTGLAFDITVPGVSFTGTQQQKWLHAHCAEYGFIVRFTAEKQKLTGFVAESWHFRYVGQEAAAVITQNGWCLEEYVEKRGL